VIWRIFEADYCRPLMSSRKKCIDYWRLANGDLLFLKTGSKSLIARDSELLIFFK
jgi:hypothetical protein